MAELNNTAATNDKVKDPGFNIDIPKLLNDFLRFWWLFVITIVIGIASVEVVQRYSLPVYRAYMTILVDEMGESNSKSSMMEGFGLTPGMRNVDNQIAVLSSWDMINHTVSQLDFHVSYFIEGRLKDTEMYGNLAFEVAFDSTHVQLLNTPLKVEPIDDNSYRLSVNCEDGTLFNYSQRKSAGLAGTINYSKIHHYNETVITPWAAFNVRNKSFNISKGMYFVFNNPESVAAQLKNAFWVNKTNETSSIIGLSVSGTNHQKNVVFLNRLAKEFIDANLNQKNKIATNTIEFIESQLVNISDSLRNVGTELSNFRTVNKIQSISSKADYLFGELQRIETDLNQIRITKEYYRYLTVYFGSDSLPHDIIAPAMPIFQEAAISQQIKELMDINTERLTLTNTYGQPGNPLVGELNSKYRIARNILIQSIKNNIQRSDESFAELMDRKRKTEDELYSLPETERKMLGIERKFELNNEVYTFLLRKRSESQIQKASNTPDIKVLETARYAGQISPNIPASRKKALMIAVVLPVAFLVLRQLLNRRIQGAEDIAKLTSIPVVGEIIHNTKNVHNVVLSHPKSVIAESFRRVRTRMDFFTGEIANPVIAVSSSIPGEGKTFCALNLASVYALAAKKTILLGFDLRRPGLNQVLGMKGKMGLSNYLIGQCSLDEVIVNLENDNLFVIPAGDIPPNPSELISGDKTKQLLAELKNRFDVIVIDTPPMGIVSDPFLLARLSDVLIFLARDRFSMKDVFSTSVRAIMDEGIDHVGILINDYHIENKKYSYRYGKGYRYHYGYNTGYYED